jgi:iron complex transport system permease protein
VSVTHPRHSTSALPALVVALAVMVVSVVMATGTGAAHISATDVMRTLAAHIFGAPANVDAASDTIIWDIRLPRVVLAALVGAALSIAGASFQGAFRNPLADPYLLGAAAGAGVGATLAIGYIQEPALLTPLAFLGSIAGVLAAWTLGSATGGLQSSAVMVLAGVAVMSFLTAVQTLLQQQRSDSLQQVYSWILGQLANGGWTSVHRALPGIVIGSTILVLYSRALDLLELGDDKAKTMGLSVHRSRMVIVLAASLATASAVSVSGLIGFVGLIVPHVVRRFVGTSYRRVLPMSLVVGASFVVVTDLIARTVIAPAELPIGVITAFLGAPFFAWLLYVTKNSWAR